MMVDVLEQLVGESRPPLRQTSVTFRRAPKANVESVTRLRSIWEDSAGTEKVDDLEDLEDAAEEATRVGR
jgi:hypothetical protein